MEKHKLSMRRDFTPLLLALLMKLENNNICPLCGWQGKAQPANDCQMCRLIMKERFEMQNPTLWEDAD